MKYLSILFLSVALFLMTGYIDAQNARLKQILYYHENEVWQLNSDTLAYEQLFVVLQPIFAARLSSDEQYIYLIEGNTNFNNVTGIRQLTRINLTTGVREVLLEKAGLENIYPSPSNTSVIVVYRTSETDTNQCLLDIEASTCSVISYAKDFYWHNGDVIAILSGYVPGILDFQTLNFTDIGLSIGEWQVLHISAAPNPDEVLLIMNHVVEDVSTYNLAFTLNLQTKAIAPFRFNGFNDSNGMIWDWSASPNWLHVAYKGLFNFKLVIADGNDGHAIREWDTGVPRSAEFIDWLNDNTLFFADQDILSTYIINAADYTILDNDCHCHVFGVISQPNKQ